MKEGASAVTQEGRQEATRLLMCRCIDALPEDIMRERGVPLPAADKTVLFSSIPWEALQVCFSRLVFLLFSADYSANGANCLCSILDWALDALR
jgi:hypothetical protein